MSKIEVMKIKKIKSKNIIKLYLGDGLGNNIFQYLAAKYFQKELFSDSIKFVHQGIEKDFFDLTVFSFEYAIKNATTIRRVRCRFSRI